MRFLVFTTDLPPLPGLPTSGTALRTHGLAQGLRAHGHEVEVSVPRAAIDGLRRPGSPPLESAEAVAQVDRLTGTAFDFRNQADLVHALAPDVVLCGHWPAATFESRPSQPLVIDLAGAHLLERHYQGTPGHAAGVLGKLRAVSHADYFVVSGSRQRRYFMSFLLRAGVEEPERRTVSIPMPLCPDQPPRRPAPPEEYPRIVFGGVFLPWQDPTDALERTAAALAAKGRGTLEVIGGPHPHYSIDGGVYAALFSKLARLPFVRARPLLSFDEFVGELLSSDVALDLMRWNLERELAVTIRSTTYLWAGVPVIYNDYSDLGDLIRAYDAGWTIDPSDGPALARVLDAVFEEPALVGGKGENARRLARDVFAWDRAVLPLLEALGGARRKPRLEVDVAVVFPENASLSVLAGRGVEQYFVSRIDGLARVEVCLATHRRTRIEGVTLSLYRLAAPHPAEPGAPRTLVARRELPGSAIQDNGWQSVEAEPIRDSAGHSFVLAIESPASRKEESVSPWAFGAEPFPLRGLYHGGRLVPRSALCFRTSSLPGPC